MYTCPECGQLAEMNNNICEHCGVKVKICPDCGTALDLSTEICDFCGISLAKAASAPVQTTATAPVQNPQTTTANEEDLDKLKMQERDLARFAEDSLKPYLTAAKMISLASVLVMIFGIFTIPFSYTLGGSKMLLMNLSFIVAFLIGCLSDIFRTFAPVFSASKVANKVKQDNFDYKTFYKNVKIYKHKKHGVTEEATDRKGIVLKLSLTSDSIILSKALAYKEKPSSVIAMIIGMIIYFHFSATALVIALISFNLNFPNLDYSNPLYWVAFIIFILGAVILGIFSNSDKHALNLIFDIKESNE